MNKANNRRRMGQFPAIKPNPKLTPGKPPVDKDSKKKVVYDRVIVFDFSPTPDYGFIYSLTRAQTAESGITDQELNVDIFRLRNRESKRLLNIWSPPHHHMVLTKVDSRKYEVRVNQTYFGHYVSFRCSRLPSACGGRSTERRLRERQRDRIRLHIGQGETLHQVVAWPSHSRQGLCQVGDIREGRAWSYWRELVELRQGRGQGSTNCPFFVFRIMTLFFPLQGARGAPKQDDNHEVEKTVGDNKRGLDNEFDEASDINDSQLMVTEEEHNIRTREEEEREHAATQPTLDNGDPELPMPPAGHVARHSSDEKGSRASSMSLGVHSRISSDDELSNELSKGMKTIGKI